MRFWRKEQIDFVIRRNTMRWHIRAYTEGSLSILDIDSDNPVWTLITRCIWGESHRHADIDSIKIESGIMIWTKLLLVRFRFHYRLTFPSGSRGQLVIVSMTHVVLTAVSQPWPRPKLSIRIYFVQEHCSCMYVRMQCMFFYAFSEFMFLVQTESACNFLVETARAFSQYQNA